MSIEMTLNMHSASSEDRRKTLNLLEWVAIAGAVLILAFLIYHHMAPAEEAAVPHVSSTAEAHGAHSDTAVHGPPAGYSIPPLWACLPFVAILLAIAVFPLIRVTEHWWESNKNRLMVSLVLAALTLLYYAFVQPMTYNHETMATYTGLKSVVHVLEHAVLIEYIPFIVLLFSLYVISGGISVRGDLAAHPGTNAVFLGVGATLASFIGTTGASMLLIRPLLQTNSERKYKRHTVIFFIFLVSNCGGLLLPIGDPPLFLGYLRGVPFLWTTHLFWEWLIVCGALLGIYFVWDTLAYRREPAGAIRQDEAQTTRLRLSGTHNFIFLVGIVLCVALVDPSKKIPWTDYRPFPFLRELLMLLLVVLSLKTTRNEIYKANAFNYHAILEVAALFIGIFICMQVPIEILHQKGATLGLSKPWHFFWTTGSLSAFLDNAPTYVVFFTTATALPESEHMLSLIGGGHIDTMLLTAISLGAVFMGSLTYIGNGPNFMVKSIAEQSGVRMPSFFGYMCYSFAILIPLFVIVTFVFLRG